MKSTRALLVIDMQLVAFDGKITPPITNGSQLLENVSSLIAICRTTRIPIVFIQTCALSGQPYAKDTHGWEIHPEISPQPQDRTVYKRNSSGFDETDLHQVLTKIGVNAVVICGIWSDFCVANTSISALELGYDVYVAADAHGTVSNSEQEANNVVSQQNDHLSKLSAHVSKIADLSEELAKS